MSLVVPKSNQRLTLSGLESVTTTIVDAGSFELGGKISLPQNTGNSSAGNSAAVMTITQNVTVIYTGPAGGEGFHLTVNAAAGDTLTFALTSAAAVDQPSNAVKAVITIG